MVTSSSNDCTLVGEEDWRNLESIKSVVDSSVVRADVCLDVPIAGAWVVGTITGAIALAIAVAASLAAGAIGVVILALLDGIFSWIRVIWVGCFCSCGGRVGTDTCVTA